MTAGEVSDVPTQLAARLAECDTPEVRMALGLIHYMQADFVNGVAELERAFLAFKKSGRHRRAAVAAAHLGRLQHDGVGNLAAANGWFARGRRLLSDDQDCVERGWVALATVGCSVPSATRLEQDADLALMLARRYDEIDLECKALADSGLALVRLGSLARGTLRIDEAMAMISSGECDNQFIAGQVMCCMITACERSGDLTRLEGWLADRLRRELLLPQGAPTMLYAHCQTEFGSLLCHVGRWSEADSTLRLAVAACDNLHFHHKAASRAALATLRIEQGRLSEAGALLDGLDQRPESQLSVARLHFARGDNDLAAATLRNAIRLMDGDRLVGGPMLALLVQAELARGRQVAAAAAAAELVGVAEAVPEHAGLGALAALATGQVAAARADFEHAIASFEQGLRILGGQDRLLLAAELQLALAEVLSASDGTTAVTHARAALAVFGSVGARRAHDAQQLLHDLGVGALSVQLAGPPRLTPREREILLLLGEGLSNPAIAARLFISRKTAEHHVSAVLHKLHLRSRSEAAIYAASLASRGSRAPSSG